MKTEHERVARQLLEAGYRTGVVARKLISEHGLTADEAEALVGRLTGSSVDAFAGDALTAVLGGTVIGTLCVAASAFIWWRLPSVLGQVEWWAHGVLWSTAGAAFTKAFIAFMNRDARGQR